MRRAVFVVWARLGRSFLFGMCVRVQYHVAGESATGAKSSNMSPKAPIESSAFELHIALTPPFLTYVKQQEPWTQLPNVVHPRPSTQRLTFEMQLKRGILYFPPLMCRPQSYPMGLDTLKTSSLRTLWSSSSSCASCATAGAGKSWCPRRTCGLTSLALASSLFWIRGIRLRVLGVGFGLGGVAYS